MCSFRRTLSDKKYHAKNTAKFVVVFRRSLYSSFIKTGVLLYTKEHFEHLDEINDAKPYLSFRPIDIIRENPADVLIFHIKTLILSSFQGQSLIWYNIVFHAATSHRESGDTPKKPYSYFAISGNRPVNDILILRFQENHQNNDYLMLQFLKKYRINDCRVLLFQEITEIPYCGVF